MKVSEWQADIDTILGHRPDNGADHWATPDGRIYVGNPYSTIASLCMPSRTRRGAGSRGCSGWRHSDH